jgi:amidase
MSDIHYLSLMDLSRRLQKKQISSLEVTRHMLERIRALDGQLRSYVTGMADVALAQAEQADKEIAAGTIRGPLHGVPLGLKDLCATKDAPTHVGSFANRDWNPGVDCTVVKKLRDAGAVFLGKLQLTEGAYGVHHPDIAPPINPWSADHWTGVSSSGSGVATAAGLCFGSLGTDTGGSIRSPSHCNGITGIKQTWGRVSRAGAFALSESLDHIGPLARSTEDCAAILGIIAGRDPDDPTSLTEPVPDYLAEMKNPIKGMKIGLDEADCSGGVDAQTSSVVMEAISVLESRGAEIVPFTVPDMELMISGWERFTGVETAIFHEGMYPQKKELYGPGLSELIEIGRKTSGVEYAKLQQARQIFAGELAGLFETMDCFIAPALPYPTPTLAFMGELCLEEGADDLLRLIRFTSPYDMSGTPTLSLPGGLDKDGLPIGFQLCGPHLGEVPLIRAGYAYQLDTDWHTDHPPQYT